MDGLLHPTCKQVHDPFTLVLSTCLIIGLIISYLPQHWKIIEKKSSEGLSPWYLLLGSTSAAAGLLNVVTLQWKVIKCCRDIGAGYCIESLLGVVQVFAQWIMFNAVLVLYLIYFPPHLKFSWVTPKPHPGHSKTCECETCMEARGGQKQFSSSEWNLSVVLAWVVFIHFLLCLFVTFFLVLSDPWTIEGVLRPRVQLWATFLGLCSTALCIIQYIPQLYRTWHLKLVGSLSIGMMLIQTPGAVLLAVSMGLREGTNWTSWAMYAASAIMQGSLLVMCLFWRSRQTRLQIDEFGNPIDSDGNAISQQSESTADGASVLENQPERREALDEAPIVGVVGEGEEEHGHGHGHGHGDESTPLLGNKSKINEKAADGMSGWLPSFLRR